MLVKTYIYILVNYHSYFRIGIKKLIKINSHPSFKSIKTNIDKANN